MPKKTKKDEKQRTTKGVNSSELLDCPFCGNKPEFEEYPTLILIGCKECGYNRGFKGCLSGAETKPIRKGIFKSKTGMCEFVNPSFDYKHQNKENAIIAWNQRAI